MISIISVTTSNITPTTSQTMIYGIIAVITLVIFLGLREVLEADENKSKKIKAFISESDIVIIPLLIVFAGILIYKIITILK
ncbi:MAG TPA: hypothetical protein HA298_06115 [Methanobacteriales archaeon]|nr:MAG: Uncharacterized protein XD44_0473 [Methanobacteriaceae archaeon 41_258]MBC7089486.1 hypothetical protein [Methanobacteriaceae archaeon]MBC7096366.1 hypothetical protein [Methanobacteriales archaeon]MDI3484662.1 hypothetical protein [Methanobacteriaceae archaeon]HIH62232.1 hypothetical protein [Methanobacteriales archaeon]